MPDCCGASAGPCFKSLEPDETALKGEELGKEGFWPGLLGHHLES